MKVILVFCLCLLSLRAADTCSSGGFYGAYCQPETINGKWLAVNRVGYQSNDEQQCYSPSNVFAKNGLLTIVSRKVTATCNGGAGAITAPATYNYTSGYVQMKDFHQQYGDWLIRAKMTIGTDGSWPAIWMLGYGLQQSEPYFNASLLTQGCDWHATGCEELDIAEFYNSNTEAKANQFLNASTPTCGYAVSNAGANWHTYELRWTADAVTWYLDGVATTCTSAQMPTTPMYLVMNVAMGGVAGTITDATLPQSMQVDYVKVCSDVCDGNNTTFFEDFDTAVSPALLRPMARLGRLAGIAVATDVVNSIRGGARVAGSAVMRFR